MIKKLLILVAWVLVGVVVGLVLAMTGIAVFTDMTFGEFVRLLVSLNPGEVFAAALSGVAALIVAVPVLVLVHETGHLVCGLLSGLSFCVVPYFQFHRDQRPRAPESEAVCHIRHGRAVSARSS